MKKLLTVFSAVLLGTIAIFIWSVGALAAPPQGIQGNVTVQNDENNPVPVTGDLEIMNDGNNPVPVTIQNPELCRKKVPFQNFCSVNDDECSVNMSPELESGEVHVTHVSGRVNNTGAIIQPTLQLPGASLETVWMPFQLISQDTGVDRDVIFWQTFDLVLSDAEPSFITVKESGSSGITWGLNGYVLTDVPCP